LESVQRNALRLLSLINDLLALASLDKKTLVVDATPLNVGQLIERLMQDVEPMASQKGIAVAVDIEKESLVYCLARVTWRRQC
jgi:signal transduction histidine kinase